MKRFKLDPSHTLTKLAEMNQNFAPNAHVLQSLAICLHRSGHVEQAFKAACQAFPLCFENGYVIRAAAMFYELRAHRRKFGLDQEQILVIAKELHEDGELAAAAKAYSMVIHEDPNEMLAVTALVQVADQILSEKNNPDAALKVYLFLEERCGDPGMIDTIQDGVKRCHEAERAAAETNQPEIQG